MRVTTWNVNGIRAREAQVLEWVEKQRPDVLCLQEVKASPEAVPVSLCALPGYWCYWHGHKGYSGVGLHLRKERFPRRPVFSHPEFDHEHRIVAAQVQDLVFTSIYVPNGNKEYPPKVRFLEALAEFVRAHHLAGRRVLLCGDLNVAREPRDVHPKLRKPEQIGQTPEEQALLERVIGQGLVDLGRKYEPDNDRLFTWWAPWRNLRQRNIGWRIDYILASHALAARTLSFDSQREFGTSDHAPLLAVFDVSLPAGPTPHSVDGTETGSAPSGPREPRNGRLFNGSDRVVSRRLPGETGTGPRVPA